MVDVVFTTESLNRAVNRRTAVLIVETDVVRLGLGEAVVGAFGWVTALVDDGAIRPDSDFCVVAFEVVGVEVRNGY